MREGMELGTQHAGALYVTEVARDMTQILGQTWKVLVYYFQPAGGGSMKVLLTGTIECGHALQ